jgi:hypothetical protein
MEWAGVAGMEPPAELFVYDALNILRARTGTQTREYCVDLRFVLVGVDFEVDAYRVPIEEETRQPMVEFAVLTTKLLSSRLNLFFLGAHL